jgi:RNA polymerase sigma-70 factor (ECF subfamily)
MAHCLEQVQLGSELAMASLYDRHSRVVYSVAIRVLRDASLAEDVLQEAFLQVWRERQSHTKGRTNFSGWLAVVTRNRAIAVLRQRHPSLPVEDLMIISPYNLANHAEQNLLCDKAQRLIATLTSYQRGVLEMAFFDGMTHADIAAATGCPLEAVKSRIHGALSMLRRSYESTVGAPGAERVIPKDEVRISLVQNVSDV